MEKKSLKLLSVSLFDQQLATVEHMNNRLKQYLPLYKAAIADDWEAAKKIFQKEPEAVRAGITSGSETALIVAVKAVQRYNFVEKLVQHMSPEELAICDNEGRTALHRAAGSGNIKATKLLVEKYGEVLLSKEAHHQRTPLFYAASRGDEKTISYLMERMKATGTQRLEDDPGFHILYHLTISKRYDIALKVLGDNSELAAFIPKKEEDPKKEDPKNEKKKKKEGDDLENHALTALAGNPSSFPSGNNHNFLKEFIYSKCMELEDIPLHNRRSDEEALTASKDSGAAHVPLIKAIRQEKIQQDQALALLEVLCKEVIKSGFSNADKIFRLPLERATSMGIPEIVEKILELYPYAASIQNDQKQSIFQQAIVFRQEKVFNLIYQLEESKEIVLSRWDASGNNSLHLAGYVEDPQLVYLRASAAFQMQRELQWFKEVEGLVVSRNKEHRNKKGKTPAQVFSDTHKELVKEGEEWMKGTAESCTIIASLIATVVFAAAITVPGGSNDNGRPIFEQQSAFKIFGISNGLALFSSIASLVMFLSVLTSSTTEEDFLSALPKKMIIGLISLFICILFTMAAFGATIYLVFGENKGLILILVGVLACIPGIMFMALQFPLLKRMIKSTYCSSIFGKRSDRMLL